MHPAIEIIDSRFADLATTDALSRRADQQNHDTLAVGPARCRRTDVDPVHEPVRLTIQGVVRAEAVGGNSAIDPERLLEWWTNHGARSLGSPRAGQVITTGSCTGTIFVAPSTRVRADFLGLGGIEVAIA
jgi:2-keto-4-pentenoate hydratase